MTGEVPPDGAAVGGLGDGPPAGGGGAFVPCGAVLPLDPPPVDEKGVGDRRQRFLQTADFGPVPVRRTCRSA